MLWIVLQVCWLVSLLDIRSMAFDDSTTINLKTKNNGKIDPFSFDVFPTSNDDSFGNLSKNDEKMFETEENDPDMEIFFKDVDFFKDDDSFYKRSFGDDTINDFFSRSLEESRIRYKEDVDNIDKMFKTPVKSSIDEILKGETTHVNVSSRNLNSLERTTERNGFHTTKRDTAIPKAHSSNTQIPVANSVHSENSLKPNSSLFFDINRAAHSNVVSKLVPVTDRDKKDVFDDVRNKDENRKARGSDINKGLAGPEENAFLDKMTVVTEISVQETVNGRTVKRKPSNEELRHIKTKLPVDKRDYETQNYDDLIQNRKPNNNLSSNQEEGNTAQDNLPNDVIDDLASFLKVDPNFADDGEGRMLIDDEEVKDMDVILSDNNEYDESLIKNDGRRNEKPIKIDNIKNDDDRDNGQDINVNKVDPNEKDQEANTSLSSNTEDPRKYRKIFHTEHKNSSNVSDVKIMFSETEGDFLDEDDDSEYSMNNTEMPQKEDENKTIKNIKSSNKNSKQLKMAKRNSTELKPETELPSTQDYTDLPELQNENVNQNMEERDIDSPELTTILDQFVLVVTKPPQTTETLTINYNEELTTYSDGKDEKYTEIPQQMTDDILITENLPSFTEKEEQNADEESTTVAATSTTPEHFTNTNPSVDEKVVLSSQNINDTMNSEESVTEFYEDLENPISETTDEPFLDEIDRTMAIIRKILAESEALEKKEIDEKLQLTQSIIGTKEREETVTIPLDTSTVSIDSTTFGEEFTDPMNGFNNIEVTTDNKFTTEANLPFIGTTEPVVNTDSYGSVNTVIYTNTFIPVADTTELNIITTGEINNAGPVLTDTSIEIGTTDAPRIVDFKESELKHHEISPSEVESMYNSKIEEYESLEDASDDSEENADGWTIFGSKNKEYESKMDEGKEKNGLGSIQKPNTNTVLVGGDKQVPIDIGKANGSIVMDKGPLVSVLNGIVLNNTAEFSVKITKEDEAFYVPSSAYIREYANTINITWETNEYLNNSIALRISEEEEFYIIKEIMVNILSGNEFKKLKKSVSLAPLLDDSVSEQSKVVRMKDGTNIFFSNVDFLRKNYDSSEYSEASMRQRRLWHIEIAIICLAVIVIISAVFYIVVIKTKRKITLREKNELAQVTHC